MSKRSLLTRREALRLGRAAGLGFLLPAVLSGRSHAQTGTTPKRVVFILSQNGVMTSGWRTGAGAALDFSQGAMAPLNRHLDDAVAISGARYQHDGGHVWGSLTYLTNQRGAPFDQNNENTRAPGASLDFELSRHLRAQGHSGSNLLTTTAAGSDAWGGGEFITYEGPGTPIRALRGANAVWNRLFAGYMPPGPGPVQPGPTRPPDWERRSGQSVLDFVLEEYNQMSSVLGPDAGRRLDEVATSIRELEQTRLNQLPADGAEPPPPVAACTPGTNPGGDIEPDVFDRINRVLVEALACEETLVATIRFSHGFTNNAEHHSWHHGEGSPDWEAQHNAHTTWQAEQVAQFADRLAAKTLPGGDRLLDHTLVVWCNEIGVGGAQEHGGNNLPLVLLGSMGGRVQTRQHINLNGVSHSTLLVSVAQGMGMDIDGFGDMTGCQPGGVPGLLI